MMNSILSTTLIVCALVGYVSAVCYRQAGCSSTWGKGRTYRIGQRWKPKEDPCYTCKCVKAKKTVVKCQVAVEEIPQLSLKKSKLSARFESMPQYPKEEFVKITRKEAKKMECPPIKAPTYNWETGTFDAITYKTVNYYYTRKMTRCCSRYIGYTNVHPSCKVVKINKCESKVVRRDNPRESCYMPMRFLG